MHKLSYVLTEGFCQYPFENYFGKQRSSGAHKDKPPSVTLAIMAILSETRKHLNQWQQAMYVMNI